MVVLVHDTKEGKHMQWQSYQTSMYLIKIILSGQDGLNSCEDIPIALSSLTYVPQCLSKHQ